MKMTTWKNRRFSVFSRYVAAALMCFGPANLAHAYQFFDSPFNHWNPNSTASLADSGGTVAGNPVILTWSLVPDGTDIAEGAGEPVADSDLIAFLNANFGSTGATLAERPWFPIFNSAYERWEEVSGLTIAYEPNDDGIASNSAGSNGSIGVRGDLRVGGHFIDGQTGSNTLAFNFSPNSGDMVIDTSNVTTFTNPTNDFRLFRNTLTHEIGHGLGIDHLDSSNSKQLMEPFIDTSFDGPQHDDIRSLQRQYGDTYERGGGNDTALTATSLGSLAPGGAITIGSDAGKTTVFRTDIDFLSIDDDTDIDFLSFTLTSQVEVSLTLTPMGLTFNEGPQDGTQTSVNTAQISDLTLALFGTDGTTLLGMSTMTGIGGSESLAGFLLDPGTYYSRITGTADDLQFYQLAVFAVPVPEPGSLALLAAGLAGVGFLLRRRRRGVGS